VTFRFVTQRLYEINTRHITDIHMTYENFNQEEKGSPNPTEGSSDHFGSHECWRGQVRSRNRNRFTSRRNGNIMYYSSSIQLKVEYDYHLHHRAIQHEVAATEMDYEYKCEDESHLSRDIKHIPIITIN
jgi:hypothetical protein